MNFPSLRKYWFMSASCVIRCIRSSMLVLLQAVHRKMAAVVIYDRHLSYLTSAAKRRCSRFNGTVYIHKKSVWRCIWPLVYLPQGPSRTSSLQAPIMLMSGHEGEVYCCKFHPNGATLASSGFDRLICKLSSVNMAQFAAVYTFLLKHIYTPKYFSKCFFPAVMWNVYGECDNFATLKGHSGAVMELHYNTDGRCGHGHPQKKTN